VEVVELLAVELDDRDALEQATMKRRIGLDVALLERMPDALEDRAGIVAEVTIAATVEDQTAHRACSPVA
jgi:hypothetical protein